MPRMSGPTLLLYTTNEAKQAMDEMSKMGQLPRYATSTELLQATSWVSTCLAKFYHLQQLFDKPRQGPWMEERL
jgi:hypothetical protein